MKLGTWQYIWTFIYVGMLDLVGDQRNKSMYIFAKDRGRTLLSRIKLRREDVWLWPREILRWRSRQETKEGLVSRNQHWVYKVIMAERAAASGFWGRPTLPGELSGHGSGPGGGGGPGFLLRCREAIQVESSSQRPLAVGKEALPMGYSTSDIRNLFTFLKFYKLGWLL